MADDDFNPLAAALRGDDYLDDSFAYQAGKSIPMPTRSFDTEYSFGENVGSNFGQGFLKGLALGYAKGGLETEKKRRYDVLSDALAGAQNWKSLPDILEQDEAFAPAALAIRSNNLVDQYKTASIEEALQRKLAIEEQAKTQAAPRELAEKIALEQVKAAYGDPYGASEIEGVKVKDDGTVEILKKPETIPIAKDTTKEPDDGASDEETTGERYDRAYQEGLKKYRNTVSAREYARTMAQDPTVKRQKLAPPEIRQLSDNKYALERLADFKKRAETLPDNWAERTTDRLNPNSEVSLFLKDVNLFAKEFAAAKEPGGRLSNQDFEIVQSYVLPSLFDTKSTAIERLNMAERALSKNRDTFMESFDIGKYNVKEFPRSIDITTPYKETKKDYEVDADGYVTLTINGKSFKAPISDPRVKEYLEKKKSSGRK